jgi:hypothetical protein
MQITKPAVNAILDVMKSKGLDPKTTFLEIGVFEGNLGIGFTRDKIGRIMKHGDLTVILASNLDTTGVVVDFGEINKRKGLIFLGEENGDNSNR